MKSTMLIIDDEEVTRIFLTGIFTEKGYSVTTAQNGTEGLACAQNGSFDIIITDMIMPGIQGAELIARLRQSGSDTPIIAITGNIDGEASLELIKDYHVNCVLFKPFLAAEICSAVDRVIMAEDAKTTPSWE